MHGDEDEDEDGCVMSLLMSQHLDLCNCLPYSMVPVVWLVVAIRHARDNTPLCKNFKKKENPSKFRTFNFFNDLNFQFQSRQIWN